MEYIIFGLTCMLVGWGLGHIKLSDPERWLIAAALEKYGEHLKMMSKMHAKAGHAAAFYKAADELRSTDALAAKFPDRYER
jgi:hypothetical protein